MMTYTGREAAVIYNNLYHQLKDTDICIDVKGGWMIVYKTNGERVFPT